MGFNSILFQKEENIAIITMNQSRNMNALSNELIEELILVIDEVESDDEIGALIITGQKKYFAVGADIREVVKLESPIHAHNFINSIKLVFTRIENLEKPVIAAISGLTLGGGCELTMVCDIRIASENAKFGLPEINIGVLPGGGGTQRLPRIIGVGRAKELLFTGDTIDAQEAYRIGLVNKIVPDDSLMDKAKELAIKLSKKPTYGLRMIKTAVNNGMNMELGMALSYESRCFEFLFSTEDQKEGLKAFVEKRKPVFRGE